MKGEVDTCSGNPAYSVSFLVRWRKSPRKCVMMKRNRGNLRRCRFLPFTRALRWVYVCSWLACETTTKREGPALSEPLAAPGLPLLHTLTRNNPMAHEQPSTRVVTIQLLPASEQITGLKSNAMTHEATRQTLKRPGTFHSLSFLRWRLTSSHHLRNYPRDLMKHFIQIN